MRARLNSALLLRLWRRAALPEHAADLYSQPMLVNSHKCTLLWEYLYIYGFDGHSTSFILNSIELRAFRLSMNMFQTKKNIVKAWNGRVMNYDCVIYVIAARFVIEFTKT